MNKRIIVTICLLGVFFATTAQDKYLVNIDLNEVVDDKVRVTINLPITDQNEIEFQMPKIVPGTYSISDFGRFVTEFEALDTEDNPLEAKRLTDNRVLILKANKLKSISYWVDDSFDHDSDNIIFEPAGTNIEEGENFVINTFGFVGYLEGFKDFPYEVTIQYPAGMFGASSLNKKEVNDSVDVYQAPNYFDLADGPIMYAAPDTTSFEVGGAEILISVYSPNKVLDPEFVREQLEPTLLAQREYLGELPVDRYAFIIYLFENNPLSGKLGALEHSYSSFYCLPEISPFHLAQVIRDVAAHEFFHIVTPLNIHSEEIGSFDFIDPKMSKHLWMYEGTTEYAASLAQVKYGEMTLDKYLGVLSGKIMQSQSSFDDTLPFTELSLNCLNETKNQYGNVYQKGALIGLALDIQLLELSNGAYGIQNLMSDLSKKYGIDTAFKDEELFDTITELTYPEIGEFFKVYVEGTEPLPYQKIFEKVGVDFQAKKRTEELSLGHISFSVNESDNRLIIRSIDQMNTFGYEMGYEVGDIIYKFDGVEIDIENYEYEFQSFTERHEIGDKIQAIVIRTNTSGKEEKVKLKARAMSVKRTIDQKMELMQNPSEVQMALLKAWVGK